MRNSIRGLVMCLATLGLFVVNMHMPAAHASRHDHGDAHKVTVWVQVLDSCQQALGGELVTLTGNGQHVEKNIPSGGLKTVERVFRQCPLQRGNCPHVNNLGCTTFDLPAPDSGSVGYTLTLTRGAPNYSVCLKDECNGPEKATITVTSDGDVSATVSDSTIGKVYPEHGDGYNGSNTDPILLHSWDNR